MNSLATCHGSPMPGVTDSLASEATAVCPV
jgi:hypothetical protein